ncbi:MAG: hypothetical protein K0U93_30905 [Gammaproteobacteria bacterium]|nr:hypothetical protein [Gammaproteobacteria bacterium]
MSDSNDGADLFALMNEGAKAAQAMWQQMADQYAGGGSPFDAENFMKSAPQVWQQWLTALNGVSAGGNPFEQASAGVDSSGINDILQVLREAQLQWVRSGIGFHSQMLTRHAMFMSVTASALAATSDSECSTEHRRRTFVDETNLYLDDMLSIIKREAESLQGEMIELGEQLRQLAGGAEPRDSARRNVRAKP